MEYGDEYVDPREIYDHVKNSSDPVSDLDLYKTFRVSSREMLRALGERSCTNPVFYRRDDSANDYLFSSKQLDDRWKLLRPMEHDYRCDDGGREASGIADMKGDCVIRALAIAVRCGDTLALRDGANDNRYRRVYQQLSEIVAQDAVQEFQYELKRSEGVSGMHAQQGLGVAGALQRVDERPNQPAVVERAHPLRRREQVSGIAAGLLVRAQEAGHRGGEVQEQQHTAAYQEPCR